MSELMDTRALAYEIKKNIQKNFEVVHLSGNLSRSVRVTQRKGNYRVHVIAPTYDEEIFKKQRVLVYDGRGSYAQEVNLTGGYSGEHIYYVEYSIMDAIRKRVKEEGKEVIIRYE